MGEMILGMDQQDELDLRISFLKEVFQLLFETRMMKNITAANFDTLLLDASLKLDEIKGILDGKDIIKRDEDSVFGLN